MKHGVEPELRSIEGWYCENMDFRPLFLWS